MQFERLFSLSVAAQIFFICMPIIFTLDSSMPSDRKLRVALESSEFKLILSSCISISLPLLLEIFRDCLLSRITTITYHALLSNVILVLVLLLPDVVVLAFVLPRKNIPLFICVHECRIIALLSVVYGYLYTSGGDFFKRKICSVWYVLGCTSHHLFLWQAFQPGPALLLFTVAEIFAYAAAVAFGSVAFLWLKYQYHIITSKKRAITTNEYFCSVYILSSVLCLASLSILWFSYGCPDFCKLTTNLLVGYNITYGVFYLLISVFHQGIVRSDLMVEVSKQYLRTVFARFYQLSLSSPSNFFLFISRII